MTSTIGSLCSGYGGLDLAVEATFNATTAWHCELEDAPSKILAAHWDIPNHRDIKTIDWDTVEPVDILTAGYPCQPFSHAGKRGGTDDPRHLWPFVAEAIRRVRPRLVVLENVAGHRTLGFDAVLGELAEDGYDAQWLCLRASEIGAPHGRERLFVLAADTRGETLGLGTGLRQGAPRGLRGGRPHDDGVQGTPTYADRAGSQGRESTSGRDVPDGRFAADPNGYALREQSVAVPGSVDPSVSRLTRPQLVTDTSGDGRHEGWSEPTRFVWRSDASLRRDSVASYTSDRPGIGEWSRPQPGRRSPTSTNPDGERLQSIGRQLDEQCDTDRRGSADIAWGKYEPAIRRWERTSGRVAPAPTELAPRGGQRLSPRFVEWMMGLPAGWVTDVPGITRNEQLKALGNGVVPQQAAEALRRLLPVAASLEAVS